MPIRVSRPRGDDAPSTSTLSLPARPADDPAATAERYAAGLRAMEELAAQLTEERLRAVERAQAVVVPVLSEAGPVPDVQTAARLLDIVNAVVQLAGGQAVVNGVACTLRVHQGRLQARSIDGPRTHIASGPPFTSAAVRPVLPAPRNEK